MNFTVVIPTKNEAKFLPALLESIKRQTLQPTEIIVADAKSSDGTDKIAREYGAKVVIGGTPSSGRNNGAKAVKTDLIFFFDADVELLSKDFFEKSIASFIKQKLDIATADIYPKDGNTFDKFSHKMYNTYVRVWGKHFPHAPGFCILVKRKLHEEIKGFDESISFCEDHEYTGRAGKKGNFGFLQGVCIPVSVRRMNKDGRLSIAIKYLLAELHLLFLGPIRSNIFNYTFDHLGTDYGKRNKNK